MGKKSRRAKKLAKLGAAAPICPRCRRRFSKAIDLDRHLETSSQCLIRERKIKTGAFSSIPSSTARPQVHAIRRNSPMVYRNSTREPAEIHKLIMVVDLATPDPRLKCASCDCTGARPVTGICLLCEATIFNAHRERTKKQSATTGARRTDSYYPRNQPQSQLPLDTNHGDISHTHPDGDFSHYPLIF